MNNLSFKTIWLAAFFILSAAAQDFASACTLWAATGSGVRDKGTLIAKNRDNKQGLITELRYVTREKGHRFVGLFDIEADGYVVSGVNEKGLAIINASAVSVPDIKRNVAKEDLTERMLTSFDSVDSLVKEEVMLSDSHPAFYIAADAGKMALIEIAPGGMISIRTSQEGIFVHTNHYTDEKLLSANETGTPESYRRFGRISDIMNISPRPLSIERFIAVSKDNGNGRNDSIMKTCSESTKVCTLASWVLYLPKNGIPDLYVMLTTQDQPGNVYRFALDEKFWAERFKPPLP